MNGTARAHHVAPGEGDRLTFNGTERRMKLTGADSAGQLTVYESFYPERMGHPLHIHHDAIESFYMLEGSCKFLVALYVSLW
jgi:quercetin dioxygenase-like cupin family protein